MKNIRIFHLKTFQFFVVKFSIYLNRCVFVMVRSYNVQYLEYIRYTFCFNGNCISPNTIDLQRMSHLKKKKGLLSIG